MIPLELLRLHKSPFINPIAVVNAKLIRSSSDLELEIDYLIAALDCVRRRRKESEETNDETSVAFYFPFEAFHEVM